MNVTVPAAREPALTEPPSPTKPPQVPEGDRYTALAWIMGGRTSADAAARVGTISGWVARRTADGLQLDASEQVVRYLEVVLDEVAAERRAAAVTLARVMAELEAEGWKPEIARIALDGAEPWQTSAYCSACYPNHPDPRCGCPCHLPASAVPVLAEAAVAA